MKIIALGQQKGGVGKSAAAINLACQAAAAGQKAALIDMDVDQATSFKWSKKRANGAPHVEACEPSRLESVLNRLRADGVDWVFIDLPGRSAPASSAGLVASDFIIVPCRPVDTDIEPSGSTVQAAIRAGKSYSYLMNIAPVQHDKKRARQVAAALRAAGHTVCPTIIVQRVQVQDAISMGKGANEVDPESESSKEFSDLFAWIRETVK